MYCVGRWYEPEDFFDPRTREIGFGGGGAQVAVVDTLRYAWIRPAGPDDDVGSYFGTHYNATIEKESERDRDPDTLNLELDSAWKRNIYYFYNHLFYDIANFTQDVNCAMGHFHPPANSHFAVPAGLKMKKSFETNVLILPAFLARGATMKLTWTDEVRGRVDLGTFTMERRHVARFLKRDMETEFEVEYAEGYTGNGELDAVMVVGHLCREAHNDGRRLERDDEDDEDDEGIDDDCASDGSGEDEADDAKIDSEAEVDNGDRGAAKKDDEGDLAES